MSDQRPLRVLYVVPDLAVGGAERHVTTLLPRLDPSRFEPRVICIGNEGGLFPALDDVPGRALHRTRRQAVSALVELVREMRRFRPDLVVSRGYNAEALGRIAAAIARVPHSAVWVHNHDDDVARPVLRRVLDRLLEPVTDAYYGVAHAQVDYLTGVLRRPRHKIEIIQNGVDPDGFDPTTGRDPATATEFGLEADTPVIGIVAGLRPEKNHALLLRAARRVVDELPAARVLVVGDGPERGRLEKLTAELGLAGNVVFTGARSDIAAVLGVCDLVALTSTTECFPMALLEAMAAGRPVVSTSVGGVPEMVEDGATGYLVAPDDVAALADRLAALLRDPAMAERFGRAARRRVEAEFGLRRSVEGAQRAMERTAGRGAAPIRLTLVLDVADVGGAELVLLDTFRRLDPAVVRPRLVCLRTAGALADEFRAAGFAVDVIDRRGRLDTRLARLVRSLRRDGTGVVLVTHHQRAALAVGRLAAFLARVPSIVAVHGMGLDAVGGRCLPRSTVETLRLSAALLLLAPSQGEYLRAREGVGRFWWRRTREVVIPNGITMGPPTTSADRTAARAALGVGPDDLAVGIVARLAAEKAHHVLLAAVAALAPTWPALRLVVIGDGARRGELVALADELGIAHRTVFTGARRDVPRLLPGLDIACLTSLHEAVPLAVIEAMAAGLPMVVTDCGALRDVVVDGETGFLVPVSDVPALAARLQELSADRALRARFGSAGRRRAEEHFRIEGTAARTESLLRSVVDRRVGSTP